MMLVPLISLLLAANFPTAFSAPVPGYGAHSHSSVAVQEKPKCKPGNSAQSASVGNDIVPLKPTVIFVTIPGTPLVNPNGKTLASLSPSVIAITTLVPETTLNPPDITSSTTTILEASPTSSSSSTVADFQGKFSYDPISSSSSTFETSDSRTYGPVPLRPFFTEDTLPSTSQRESSRTEGPEAVSPTTSDAVTSTTTASPQKILGTITEVVTVYTTVQPSPSSSTKPTSAQEAEPVVTDILTLIKTVYVTVPESPSPSTSSSSQAGPLPPKITVVPPSANVPNAPEPTETCKTLVVTLTSAPKEAELVTITECLNPTATP